MCFDLKLFDQIILIINYQIISMKMYNSSPFKLSLPWFKNIENHWAYVQYFFSLDF